MPRPTKQETELVKAMHQKAMLEKYRPLLDEISKYDSPDQMIKKALPMSALGLIVSQFSENEGIALKARMEILNRGLGKAVERSVNIYGDLAQMNEQDVDNQIMRLFKKNDSLSLAEGQPAQLKLKQKRKPRKNQIVLNLEAGASGETEGANPSAEEGSPTGSQD